MNEITFSKYVINSCNFTVVDEDKKNSFSDIGSILQNIFDWRTKNCNTIQETEIYYSRGKTDTYSIGMSYLRDDNSYLFALWNGITEDKNNVYYLNTSSSIVDKPEAKTKKTEKFLVPGFPTYFYIIPGSNIFYTIQFHKQNRDGIGQLKNYILQFMLYLSLHVNKELSNSSDSTTSNQGTDNNKQSKNLPLKARNYELIDYTFGKDNYAKSRVKAVFKFEKSINLNMEATIKKRLDNNKTKTLKFRTELTNDFITEKKKIFWDAFRNLIGMPKIKVRQSKYRIEADYDASDSEIKDILKSWKKDIHTEYENFGIAFDNDPRNTVWMRNYIETFSKEIAINRNESNVVDDIKDFHSRLYQHVKQNNVL